MARIFITGSSDGLGQMAAKELIQEGHSVVLHARNEARAKDAIAQNPSAETVLIGNLSNESEVRLLAHETNKLGTFDAVIHNAGVYQANSDLIVKVNLLAPYILTCLMNPPKRLIYLSSQMQAGGHTKLNELASYSPSINYSDSKLHILMFALAIARLWPEVQSNAVDPGWVPTKMGGANAPGDLIKGFKTQVWLAVDSEINYSGKYFFHKETHPYNILADTIEDQDQLLKICEQLTGIPFPKR